MNSRILTSIDSSCTIHVVRNCACRSGGRYDGISRLERSLPTGSLALVLCGPISGPSGYFSVRRASAGTYSINTGTVRSLSTTTQRRGSWGWIRTSPDVTRRSSPAFTPAPSPRVNIAVKTRVRASVAWTSAAAQYPAISRAVYGGAIGRARPTGAGSPCQGALVVACQASRCK